jgi:hypothetical protein
MTMRVRAFLLATAVVLGASALAAFSPAEPVQDAKVANLAFLAGAWTGSDGASAWESWYSSPEGGQVVGASKELHDGAVVTIDFEHFYERDGRLRMTPFPFGKKSVEFTLAGHDASAKRAIFENPEHDFPSRFTYERTDEQHLRITLEGQPGVPPGKLTLEFTRRAN